MGKKQHQKDKLYLTTTEWKETYGGHKDDTASKLLRAKFRRLPFTHCALSMQEFEHPMCTQEGIVFDIMSIVPFLKKHGINPVTGKKLDAKSLIKLNYHKNAQGEFHCPVTYKPFTATSHIVAVKPSGNVYNWEAIDQLNIKAKHWKDLLTDEPLTRADIIHLQDPDKLEKFNIESFHHIKYNLKSDSDIAEEERQQKDGTFYLRKVNQETRETLKQLEKDYKPSTSSAVQSKKADVINAAHYSTGKMAASFTSTVMDVQTGQESAVLEEDVLRYRRVKKKGYVRVLTNLGPLNLELYCDQLPKTCDNFMKHCRDGYYNNTIFHRSIKHFMIQGGDPTGTGRGGESIWGKPFNDEFIGTLKHEGRGVLSMANSGPNTNASQFFITFRSCQHLNKKHTIFGKLVGGLDTLSAMEKVETDDQDKPTEEIKIISTQIFVDPYAEADEQLIKEREQMAVKQRELDPVEAFRQKQRQDKEKTKTFKTGVGKYINPSTLPKVEDSTSAQKSLPSSSSSATKISSASASVKNSSSASTSSAAPPPKKSKLLKANLNDFSAW